jgi:hypothetical protein
LVRGRADRRGLQSLPLKHCNPTSLKHQTSVASVDANGEMAHDAMHAVPQVAGSHTVTTVAAYRRVSAAKSGLNVLVATDNEVKEVDAPGAHQADTRIHSIVSGPVGVTIHMCGCCALLCDRPCGASATVSDTMSPRICSRLVCSSNGTAASEMIRGGHSLGYSTVTRMVVWNGHRIHSRSEVV